MNAHIHCKKMRAIKPEEKMLLWMIKKYEEKNRADKSIAEPTAKRKYHGNGRVSKRLRFE